MSGPDEWWVDRASRTADVLVEAVCALPAGRRTVLLGGESGSGKSTLGVALQQALSGTGLACERLCLDDWAHLGPRTNEERRRLDPGWRGPREVDLEALAQVIEAWRGGADVLQVRRYEGEIAAHLDLSVVETEVLVVEGTYAVGLPGPALRVLLTADWRATERGRRARGRDPLGPETAEVLALESGIVQAQRGVADLWVDAEGQVSPAG